MKARTQEKRRRSRECFCTVCLELIRKHWFYRRKSGQKTEGIKRGGYYGIAINPVMVRTLQIFISHTRAQPGSKKLVKLSSSPKPKQIFISHTRAQTGSKKLVKLSLFSKTQSPNNSSVTHAPKAQGPRPKAQGQRPWPIWPFHSIYMWSLSIFLFTYILVHISTLRVLKIKEILNFSFYSTTKLTKLNSSPSSHHMTLSQNLCENVRTCHEQL